MTLHEWLSDHFHPLKEHFMTIATDIKDKVDALEAKIDRIAAEIAALKSAPAPTPTPDPVAVAAAQADAAALVEASAKLDTLSAKVAGL